MDDLISEFIEETTETLSAIDRELAGLQSNPSDKKILDAVFRFAHTTKSTCGFLGLKRLESVAEACELVLAKLRDGSIPATTEIATLIGQALERIRSLVEHLANEAVEPEGDDSDLITQFTAFALKQRGVVVAKLTPFATNDIMLAPSIPVAAPLPTVEEVQAKPASTPAKPEVNTEMLDAWMHMVGELVQTRNQLQHAFAKHGDKTLQAPLQQLTNITTELRDSVTKARQNARANTPPLNISTLLIIEAGGRIFALPQSAVSEIVALDDDATATIDTHDAPILRTRGQAIPLARLSNMLQLTNDAPLEAKGFAIVVRAENSDVALLVDQVNETTEVVVRPMGRALAGFTLYAGMSILGDESIALVLDAEGIATQFGERQLEAKRATNAAVTDAAISSYLVFNAGSGAPKAIPLSRVIRLAMVDAAHVQDGFALYDNGTIALRTVPGNTLPAGEFNIIVCESVGHTFGIAVEKIIDIMHAPLALSTGASAQYSLGSTLIAGQITEVIDVDSLLQEANT